MKTGDRVSMLESCYMSEYLAVGKAGTIIGVRDEFFIVSLDSGIAPEKYNHDSPDGWLVLESEIEVIEC